MPIFLPLLLAASSAVHSPGDYATPLPRKLDSKTSAAFEAFGAERIRKTVSVMQDWSSDQIATALRATLEDTTAIIYQRGHGVFVEYTGADGSVLMWYPYNGNVVKGRWGIQADEDGIPQACYHYFKSVNPVSGVFEPTECISPVQTISRNVVLSERKGDVFNLRSGKLPYPKSPKEVPEWPREAPGGS